MNTHQHPMRRIRQQLPDNEAREILTSATHGTLSLIDPDGNPYGVPLSFVYDGKETIYFHCARSGRKTDCIAARQECSFCVVAQDEVVPEEFTTYFKSVIVDGTISPINDSAEKLAALDMLAAKYSPGIDTREEYERFFNITTVLCLHISDISGKESIELTRQRPTP